MPELSCCIEPPLCDPVRVMGWLSREAIDAAMLRRLRTDPKVIADLSGVPVDRVKKWNKCGYSGSVEMRRKFRQRFGLDWYTGRMYQFFGTLLDPKGPV